MNITIDIRGQAWATGPNPEPLDLSPGETDTLRRLKAIAVAIKAMGWDGSLKVDSIDGEITVGLLAGIGARVYTHSYPDPAQRYTIRCAELDIDGVCFTAQEASKPMDPAINPYVSAFNAGSQQTPEPFDEFTGSDNVPQL